MLLLQSSPRLPPHRSATILARPAPDLQARQTDHGDLAPCCCCRCCCSVGIEVHGEGYIDATCCCARGYEYASECSTHLPQHHVRTGGRGTRPASIRLTNPTPCARAMLRASAPCSSYPSGAPCSLQLSCCTEQGFPVFMCQVASRLEKRPVASGQRPVHVGQRTESNKSTANSDQIVTSVKTVFFPLFTEKRRKSYLWEKCH